MKKIKIDAREVNKEIRKSGRAKHVPEGEYVVKVHEVEMKKTKDGSGRYLRWSCIITEGAHKGITLYGNTSLKKDALWSLRNLIHAATGKNIAGKIASFDPESLYGKKVGASVSDNEYDKDGKTIITSQIDSFFPKDEVNSAEEDEDDDEDEEEEEEEDDNEEEEEEEDEDEEEEEEKPKKKKATTKKKATKKKKDEDEDDEDEDLEEVDLDDI